MYDLMKPHKRLVGLGKPPLIVQSGKVYHLNSGECLGAVSAFAEHILAGGKGFLCITCGGTFPKRESLEKHMYEQHRDLLMSNVAKNAPKSESDEGGTWVPSEDMLKTEAKRMTDEQVKAQPAPKVEAPAVVPGSSTFREPVQTAKKGKK